MKFTTHNDAKIDVNGTHLQGYLSATRAQLQAIFGAPCADGYDDKVTTDTEWHVQFEDGTVVTLYDYKQHVAPGLNEVYDWHVGGKSRLTVALVHDALRESLGLTARSAA